MSATFLTGDRNAFFNALGLHYGIIVGEGVEATMVVDLKTANRFLAALADDGEVSEEEADRVKMMAMAAGLAEDFAGVGKAAQRLGFAPDHQPTSVRFVLCEDRECAGGLPHGELREVRGDGTRETQTIKDAFLFLLQAVEEGKSNAIDSAIAFQGVLKAGLPVDQEDCERRYRDLPADVRRRLEEATISASSLRI